MNNIIIPYGWLNKINMKCEKANQNYILKLQKWSSAVIVKDYENDRSKCPKMEFLVMVRIWR